MKKISIYFIAATEMPSQIEDMLVSKIKFCKMSFFIGIP
jgi:hypothetical protein